MKKVLKITGIVLGAIILLLLILPFAFRGKIKEVVLSEGNKMLNARFDFRSLDISLLRNFPRATVTLRDFNLWGIDEFAEDTLVSAGKVSATVNLMSLFGDEGYEVSRVSVEKTRLHAIVTPEGHANWDIMKPSDEPADTVQVESEEPSNFRIKLQKFILDDIDVVYDDRMAGTYASVEDLGLICSGDMSADHTTIRLKTGIEELSVRMGGIPYVSDAKIGAQIDVDADLANGKFVLKDNTVSINAIQAAIDGSVSLLDEGYEMDLTLNTNRIGFKELLSLIPAVYAQDFKSLKAEGNVTLAAWARGTLTESTVPAFEVTVNVENGSFRYPALPKGIDDIRIALSAKNPGGSPDLTTVAVNPLSFGIAGNPFAVTLNLSTPLSDPAFAMTAKGQLDLGMIREVYPLEDMELNGVLNADFALNGRLSYLDQGLYDKFAASGKLQLADMTLRMEDLPDIEIRKSIFSFSPQYLDLSETTVQIGQSDLTTNCRLENYLAFVLRGETIKGQLNLNSNNLDLNELMGAAATEEPTAEETPSAEETTASEGAMTAFQVPANIDFTMNTSLKKVAFDNIRLDNVLGQVMVKGGKLDMKNLSFNAVGGSIVANGYYSTADGSGQPELNAALKMNDLSFGETFSTFVTIQKLVPIFENLKGNFSGDMSLATRLDETMAPIYNTMNGSGSISTQNLNLSGVETIDRIAEAVQKPELKNIDVKDLKVDFTIVDGRVDTKPFDIKLGDTNLNLSGSTGLDQTIDYTGKISLPASTGVMGKLTTLDLKIGGTFTSPSVTVDLKGMAQQAATQIKEEVEDKVLESVGEKLGVDISDAQKQRDAMIAAAQEAGEKLVAEAQKQADALVEKAESKLAKVAAQAAGKKLVDEAQKQADALVEKATAEGDKLVEKAQGGEE